MQGYGLSETAPAVTKGHIADWKRFNGSCGKLLPNVEAKIVDVETRVERGPGDGDGELWFRGPNVFPGYWNRPELQKDTFSEDGFFKTGDIGYVDKKGNFYITDRLKELIKYSKSLPIFLPVSVLFPCYIYIPTLGTYLPIYTPGSTNARPEGFQVAPAELESVLLGHDEVADACVVPAHDKVRETEVPRAYVVLRPNVPRDEAKAAELIVWVEGRVAQHKRLRGGVRFVDEVPKNASGKLLRRVLKEEARREDQRAEGPKL